MGCGIGSVVKYGTSGRSGAFGFFGAAYWSLTIHVFALSIVTLVLTLRAGETRAY